MNIISSALTSVKNLVRSLHRIERSGEMTASLLARARIEALKAEQLALGHDRLAGHGFKAYSEGDQDGILQEIFRRIGTTNRHFIEFGCGNGMENNTLYLLISGWSGVWMDGDPQNIQAARSFHASALERGALRAECRMITAENVCEQLSALCNSHEIDLLSIDIDGNDFWVWQALEGISPRVVVIEYNATLRPPIQVVQKYDPNARWNRTNYFGASLSALERLGTAKGYNLVGCSLANGDAFFVRQDLVLTKFVGPFTAENFFIPPNHALFAPLREDAPPGVGEYVVPF